MTEGSTVKWTNRVILALLRIENQCVKWPQADERRYICQAMANQLDLVDGCVGIMDGCHIVLHERPGRLDGSDFFNRKGSYSFNILGICDHTRRIRFLAVGNVGRAGDNPIWTSTRMYTQPMDYFADNEYVVADSGFQPGDHCVPLFPRLPGQSQLPSNERKFNSHMSHGRVEIEHTFGILKGRFSSLRGLRTSNRRGKDEIKAGCWIRACVILHNLLHEDEDEIDDDDAWILETPSGELEEEPAPWGKELSSRHHPRRRRIMMALGLGPPGGPRYVTSSNHLQPVNSRSSINH